MFKRNWILFDNHYQQYQSLVHSDKIQCDFVIVSIFIRISWCFDSILRKTKKFKSKTLFIRNGFSIIITARFPLFVFPILNVVCSSFPLSFCALMLLFYFCMLIYKIRIRTISLETKKRCLFIFVYLLSKIKQHIT